MILELSPQIFEATVRFGSSRGGRDDRELRDGFSRLVYVLELELPSSIFLLGDAVNVTHSRIGADL